MKFECMKNLIYTFVGNIALVLLTSCSAEFENGTRTVATRNQS